MSDDTIATPRTLYVLTDQALDAFDQPVHWEGFADIVIDAEHLSVRFVPATFVGGDHNHSHRRIAGAAHLFKHKETTPLRHHHIQNDEVRIFTFRKREPLIPISGNEH